MRKDIPGLTSAQNGVRIYMHGPKQLSYFQSTHDGTLFEGNVFKGRVGAEFKDGVRMPDEPDSQATTELDRAREKLSARTKQVQLATPDSLDVDEKAVEAAEKPVETAPQLSEAEQAAVLNNRLFKTPIPKEFAENIRKFKDGVPVPDKKASVKSTRTKK